jgi:hypothetical protein
MKWFVLVLGTLALSLPAAADRVVQKDGTILTGDILAESPAGVIIRVTRGTLSATLMVEHARLAGVERDGGATTRPTTAPARPTVTVVKLLTPEPMSASVERFKAIRRQQAAEADARRQARADYFDRAALTLASLQAKLDAAEADLKAANDTAATLDRQYRGEQARAANDYDEALRAALLPNGYYDQRARERAARAYGEARSEIDARYQPQAAAATARIDNDKAALALAQKQIDAIEAGAPRP